MASAWGLAFGSAWGVAWGRQDATVPAEAPPSYGGVGHKRPLETPDDALVRQVFEKWENIDQARLVESSAPSETAFHPDEPVVSQVSAPVVARTLAMPVKTDTAIDAGQDAQKAIRDAMRRRDDVALLMILASL